MKFKMPVLTKLAMDNPKYKPQWPPISLNNWSIIFIFFNEISYNDFTKWKLSILLRYFFLIMDQFHFNCVDAILIYIKPLIYQNLNLLRRSPVTFLIIRKSLSTASILSRYESSLTRNKWLEHAGWHCFDRFSVSVVLKYNGMFFKDISGVRNQFDIVVVLDKPKCIKTNYLNWGSKFRL